MRFAQRTPKQGRCAHLLLEESEGRPDESRAEHQGSGIRAEMSKERTDASELKDVTICLAYISGQSVDLRTKFKNLTRLQPCRFDNVYNAAFLGQRRLRIYASQLLALLATRLRCNTGLNYKVLDVHLCGGRNLPSSDLSTLGRGRIH